MISRDYTHSITIFVCGPSRASNRSIADFVIETTLANLTYAQKIPLWQKQGYRVSLIYIRLNSVDVSLARVRKRVEAGGHDIPASALRRRFGRSQEYFATVYKPLVDSWYEWDSLEGGFSLRNSGGRHESES